MVNHHYNTYIRNLLEYYDISSEQSKAYKVNLSYLNNFSKSCLEVGILDQSLFNEKCHLVRR